MAKRKRSGGRDRAPESHGRVSNRGRGGEPGSGVWLYGGHAVLAALRNKTRKFQRLIVSSGGTTNFQTLLAETLEARAETAPAPAMETLSAQEIERILPTGAVHQGIAALCRPLPEQGLEVLQTACGDRRPVLILDQVTDPQNVGAVLRSASVFGSRAVITTQRHAPEATGALAKAASGALENVPYVRVINLARAMEEIRDMGFWLIGLDAQAETTLSAAKSGGATALVLGAEGKGLRRLTAENCDVLARLPLSPGAKDAGIDSLNVSAAAAVALYELVREG